MTSENYSEKYNQVFKQFVDQVLGSPNTDLVVKSDPRNNELEIGTILHNGAVVIACTKKTNRVVGDTLASWITICMKDAKESLSDLYLSDSSLTHPGSTRPFTR